MRSTNTIRTIKSVHTSQLLISLVKINHVCGDFKMKMRLKVLINSLKEPKLAEYSLKHLKQLKMIDLQSLSKLSQVKKLQLRKAKDLLL